MFAISVQVRNFCWGATTVGTSSRAPKILATHCALSSVVGQKRKGMFFWAPCSYFGFHEYLIKIFVFSLVCSHSFSHIRASAMLLLIEGTRYDVGVGFIGVMFLPRLIIWLQDKRAKTDTAE